MKSQNINIKHKNNLYSIIQKISVSDQTGIKSYLKRDLHLAKNLCVIFHVQP